MPIKSLPFAIANSQWVSLGATIALTGDFTVEAWGNRSMVNALGDGFKDVVTGHSGTSGSSINFYNDQARWYDGSTDQIIASATTGSGWHHHAWVRSGTNVLYYRDGTLDSSSTGTKNSTGTINFTSLGLGDGAGYYLDGQLEEVRIWNVARSAGAIAANYNLTVSPGTTGLVAYYNFAEADASTTVTDIVAGTYTGTLNGSPTATRVTATAPVSDPSTTMTVAATVPVPTSAATVTSKNISTVSATVPVATSSVSVASRNLLTVAATVPVPTSTATVASKDILSVAAVVPVATLFAALVNGSAPAFRLYGPFP